MRRNASALPTEEPPNFMTTRGLNRDDPAPGTRIAAAENSRCATRSSAALERETALDIAFVRRLGDEIGACFVIGWADIATPHATPLGHSTTRTLPQRGRHARHPLQG